MAAEAILSFLEVLMDVMAFGKEVVERMCKTVRKESVCGGREKQIK